MKCSFSHIWNWWLSRLGLFAFVATIVTAEEWTSPQTVALKSTEVVTVPLFNAWTIGWNADRLRHGFQGYWIAPIFYPAEDTFAFSEPQPATMVVAPVVWLTGSAVMGYKCWWWLSLTLNGLAAAWLFKSMDLTWPAQLSGGIAMQLLPIGLQRPDVLQLIPIWGILWFWGGMFLFQKAPSLRNAASLGAALACTFALCVHHALFVSITSMIACLVFVPRLKERKFLTGSLTSLIIAFAGILPIVLPIHHVSQQYGFERSESGDLSLAAVTEDYLAPPTPTFLNWDPFAGKHGRNFNPGWVRMMLGLAGAACGVLASSHKRWSLFLFVSGLVAYLLSLGGHLAIGEWTPWHFLRDYVPGFSQVRNIFRFAWIVQMVTIIFATCMLDKLWDMFGRGQFTRAQQIMAGCGLAVLTICVAIEVLPPQYARGGVPDESRHELWTRFIRENSPPGKSVACFPFSTGREVEDYDMTVRWMLLGLKHGVPIVNGYSGFFPPTYNFLKREVIENSLSADLLPVLATYDVHFIVVANSIISNDKVKQIRSSEFALELVLEDPVGISVYELKH